MKNLIIFVVVVAGAVLAWQNLPGLREKVQAGVNQYGGWTEDARKADPVGFIEHATKELKGDIVKFEEAKGELVKLKSENEAQLEKFRDEEVKATELANTIKELFKSAEETGTYPVTVAGADYDRSELIAQVNTLLQTKKNAAARQADYSAALDAIDKKRVELTDRISESNSAVSELQAKVAMVKVDTLSAEADTMLAKVNELVEGNTKVAEDPVRSIDELMKAASKQAAAEAKTEESSAALDFLNG